MAAPDTADRRLFTWVFNPFHYLSGEKAMPLGALIIAATAALGFVTRTHVDGVIDVHGGAAAPLWFHLAEGLVDWVALGLLLAAIGRFVSPSRPRFIDAFGMQALARAPFLPAVGFGGLIADCVQASLQKTGGLGGCSPGEVALFVLALTVILVCIIWAVVLMYNAFSVACNVRGARGVAAFILALVLAEVASKVAIVALARGALGTP
jgi:hypothetical protein